MRPLGPIPEGFETIDGELAVDGRTASALVEAAGDTPLFVYSSTLVTRRVERLRAAMPKRLAIHYAVKANPYGPLLNEMMSLVDGFDIASGGEMGALLGLDSPSPSPAERGWGGSTTPASSPHPRPLPHGEGSKRVDPDRISFAGPGKRDRELEAAIRAGVTLNLESMAETHRALAIADRLGVRPRLAVRVNPDFDLKGSGMKMGGGAKQFGIDAEKVPEVVGAILAAGAEWRGLHIFAGSQALDAAAIIETQAQTLALGSRLADAVGEALPACNLGGGFGIPYFPGDIDLDVETIGAALGERFADLPPALRDTAFCIELGRWLVGPAGVYLTRIVDRKDSHGEVFLVTDGGLHHQLAASGNFGTVVRRNYPVAIATRFDAPIAEEASVVGCLCTPLDRLADKAGFPRADVGDLVAVFCAGAYGATASPAQFLGQGPALEMLI